MPAVLDVFRFSTRPSFKNFSKWLVCTPVMWPSCDQHQARRQAPETDLVVMATWCHRRRSRRWCRPAATRASRSTAFCRTLHRSGRRTTALCSQLHFRMAPRLARCKRQLSAGLYNCCEYIVRLTGCQPSCHCVFIVNKVVTSRKQN